MQRAGGSARRGARPCATRARAQAVAGGVMRSGSERGSLESACGHAAPAGCCDAGRPHAFAGRHPRARAVAYRCTAPAAPVALSRGCSPQTSPGGMQLAGSLLHCEDERAGGVRVRCHGQGAECLSRGCRRAQASPIRLRLASAPGRAMDGTGSQR
eukprot:scaffold5232_cov408-Prasinococcus_capsulatus_cf.AAC.5